MALNSLFCADVPLSNYSLTHAQPSNRERASLQGLQASAISQYTIETFS